MPTTRQRKVRAPIPNPAMAGTFLVPLTRGYSAVIDATDVDAAGRYNWTALVHSAGRSRTVYAIRGATVNRPYALLHRFLWESWGLSDAPQLDHVNGDGLDCRRCNLRAATPSQNVCNTPLRTNNTSGLKGVGWHRRQQKWNARINVNGQRIHLGSFSDPSEAHLVYSEAARRLHGEFARVA